MKRTWEQGVNAYRAGVSVEEAKADLESNAEWIMGWLFAQSQSLAFKLFTHRKRIEENEKRMAVIAARIKRFEKENRMLKQQLKNTLPVQTVH